MSHAKLDNSDLYIILQDEDYDDKCVTVYALDNGAELEFIGDECVALVLPSFVSKFRRDIQKVELESLDLIDDAAHFNLDIGGQVVNGRVSLVSLKDKL